MNLAAVMHRATDHYCFALDQDTLIIKLQTGKDVVRVDLMYCDPFEVSGKFECLTLETFIVLPLHFFWKFEVLPEYKRCKYYFKIYYEDGHDILYYEDGFVKEEDLIPNQLRQMFTFPWINPIDVQVVPSWVKDTVWYQIFPDRFYSFNHPSPQSLKAWHEGTVSNADVYGGNLEGIIEKLDYLKQLGISGLYLTPIFHAGAIHKYDTIDYYEVDPMFGSKEILQRLVQRAHEKGIRIMLDGVFNHTSREFFAWQDILVHGKDSKYFDWYFINDYPFSHHLPSLKKDYYSFAFIDNMPKLNTNHPEVIDYLLKVCEYWVDTFDVDGLRLDVANELSHYFCKQLRIHMKAKKPDLYILGEIWHDSMPWLRGDEFDSVMNYPLSKAFGLYWENRDMSSEQLQMLINQCLMQYPQQITTALFNLLDSHDTERLINHVHFDLDVFYGQIALLLFMPGSPSLYYGTEFALEGAQDPDCRRCMPWDSIEDEHKQQSFHIVQSLIQLRNNYQLMKSMDIEFDHTVPTRVLKLTKVEGNRKLNLVINSSTNLFSFTQKATLFAYKMDENGILPGGIVFYEEIGL